MAVHKSKPLTTEDYKQLQRTVESMTSDKHVQEVLTRLILAVGYDAEVDMKTMKMDDNVGD